MTQHPHGSHPSEPGQTVSAAAPNVAQEKAEAEVRKIQQEVRKLEREIEAIPPADFVKRKAEAEIEKARLDAEKLTREARYYWIEPVKAVGGLSSILLAVVAVGGLWVSMETSRQTAEKAERDSQRLEREVVSALIKELGAGEVRLRATSARRLGAYVTDAKLSPSVVSSLVAALVLEGEGGVQEAILQALEPVRQAAQPELTRARSELDGEIVRLLSDIDPSTGLPKLAADQEIQGKQQAMIKITLALAASSQCSVRPCPPDFSNVMSLRRSSFISYRDRLKGSTFDNAALLEADFYGVDLSGTRFSGASLQATSFIRAKLVGARFDGSNMRLIQHPTRGTTPRTQFRNADLTGASFVEACLGGADFSESNVEPAALARGFTEGIHIEPEKLAKLGPPRNHDKCRVVQQ